MRYLVATTLVLGLLTACGGGNEEGNKEKPDTTAKVEARSMGDMKIAFYYQDSIVENFDYYREADSILQAKQIAFDRELAARQDKLQNYLKEKDRQMQNGMLSNNDIAAVQEYAQREQQKMLEYQQTKGAQIQEEMMKEQEVLANKMREFSKQFCQENGIDILLAHGLGGQLTFIDEGMNVTEEFINYLNVKQEELIKGE